MTRRYFAPTLADDGPWVTLDRHESGHAVRVMRVKVGEAVTLFDGRGNEAEGTVAAVERNACHCRCEPPRAVDREPTAELVLGVALPKPERAKELIERLTELGVRRVVPLVTERVQRGPSENLLAKLRRVVVEACKQSGRNVLLEIAEPARTPAFFNEPTSYELESPPDQPSRSTAPKRFRWLLHPDGAPLTPRPADGGLHGLAAIGPEGGWTGAEVAAAREAGFERKSLGKRILRIETAAMTAAARTLCD